MAICGWRKYNPQSHSYLRDIDAVPAAHTVSLKLVLEENGCEKIVGRSTDP
jgi:hypothetical protein